MHLFRTFLIFLILGGTAVAQTDPTIPREEPYQIPWDPKKYAYDQLITAEVIELIKSCESLSLKAYICPAKVCTIGWGCTYYQNGKKVKMGDVLTRAEAEALLLWHIEQTEKAIRPYVKVQLNINQWSALVSLAFNIGVGNFKESTLLQLVNEKKFNSAALEFPKWRKGGGRILGGLVKRRAAEAKIFLKDVE